MTTLFGSMLMAVLLASCQQTGNLGPARESNSHRTGSTAIGCGARWLAVDLDLARVRAFVTVADERHFGRAAAALSVSQQGLSKRVARLEAELGVVLLTRSAAGVSLTGAGRRFLAPARRLLAAADLAAATARHEVRPLRMDVWGHLYAPMRTVRQALEHAPDLDVELGRARDLPAVLSALSRGEIDVGFGRVHPRGGGDALDGMARRLVRLEPLDAVVGEAH